MIVKFTDDDYDFLSECLHLAQTELERTAISIARVFPTSPAVESMRKWADRASDLRSRIESRE